MKYLMLWIFAVAMSLTSVGQTYDERWPAITFDKPADYKAHESDILACATYLLSVPMNNPQRQDALNILARWMSGTPDYNFVLSEKLAKLSTGNEFVMSIYMAAAAKYILENPSQAPDTEKVELESFDHMLDYMEDYSNKFKMTKEIQKAIKAKQKGKLKEYLSK